MAIDTNIVGDIYLVAVLLNPTEAQRINGEKRTIVVAPQFILADSPQAAQNKAIMLIDEEDEDGDDLDPDRCSVFVTKPF